MTKAKTDDVKNDVPVEQIEFSQEDIKAVREAIRRARQGMAEWNEAAKVDPDKMRRPLTR